MFRPQCRLHFRFVCKLGTFFKQVFDKNTAIQGRRDKDSLR